MGQGPRIPSLVMQGKDEGLVQKSRSGLWKPSSWVPEMALVGCMYAPVLSHLPEEKHTFREEMGLGVLITSLPFPESNLVTFTQEGTHCNI